MKENKLPETREGLTQKAQVAGMKYYVTVNFFPNSERPAEIFLNIAKEGSTVSGLIDALAITISIALQHGVEWEVLGNKYLATIFEPRDDKSSSLVDSITKSVNKIISIRKEQLK